jgi:hypothetical protein
VPVDNLEVKSRGNQLLPGAKKGPQMEDLVIVSPDAGGITRARNFQSLIHSLGAKDPNLETIYKKLGRLAVRTLWQRPPSSAFPKLDIFIYDHLSRRNISDGAKVMFFFYLINFFSK